MKVIVSVLSLSIFSLVSCVTQEKFGAIDKGYETEIDLTMKTEYSIPDREGYTSLRNFIEPISANDISGVYRNPADSTGGYEIHLFPDKVLLIVASVDIAPSGVVAVGTWDFKDSVISMTVTSEYESYGSGIEWLKDDHGNLDAWHLFVTQDGGNIGDWIMVSDDTLKKKKKRVWSYIKRITYYKDWQKNRSRLLQKLSASKSRSSESPKTRERTE